MQFRILIEELSKAMFKRDVDGLLEVAMHLNEDKKLSNKEWKAFGDIAIRYRAFLID